MFRNYLKITIRNLLKHKSYSFINITGLSIGIACCILILGYVGFELSYDKFHKNHDRIFRITVNGKIAERYIQAATCPAPYGPQLKKDFPEIEEVVRFRDVGQRMFNYEDRTFYENGLIYADKAIFDTFSFELLQGDPITALEAPYTMVITHEIAERYFGNEDPIGKILRIDDSENYTVTGLIRKPPSNSHIDFDILASFETILKRNPELEQAWFSWNYQTYILLPDGKNYKAFNQKLNEFDEKYIMAVIRQMGAELESTLQPLTDIHLHSNMEAEFRDNSDIKYVYSFSAVALFILMIACINFMNLATARSANRAKEVGLRKVMGAERRRLILQFLGESVLFSLIALIFALVLVQYALPFFNALAGKEIVINYLENSLLIASIFSIVVFVGIIAGSYPALFLSGFRPVMVLKGDFKQGAKNSRFRSMLVVSQFTISIALIISTAVIYNQLNYMKNKELGFNNEQLMVLRLQDRETRNRIDTIKKEMLSLEGVINAASSSNTPGEESLNNSGYFPEGMTNDQAFLMDNFNIDHDFLDTYGIELIAGRTFSREITTDADQAVLINETAMRQLGWTEPIGKKIQRIDSNTDFSQRRDLTVIGVYKDFHYRTLYQPIQPNIIEFSGTDADRLTLKIKGDNVQETLKKIEQKWKEIDPSHPYEYYFVDETFARLYRTEEKLGNIFQAFSVFAIIIGCLGLFGLASFTSEQRTKEIGIRKSLGSSVSSIVILLCREFFVLIGIANIFAWPLAYFAMRQWLDNFPYRGDIGILIFLFAGVLAVLIALLTVGYQSIKSAFTDPVKALRYE